MSGRAPTSFVRVVWTLARKDLLIELRTREVLYSTGFFAILVVLLFAFALTRGGQANAGDAGAALWVAIALSGTLGLGRAWDREREDETLRALLLAPVARSAIYLAKLVSLAVMMLLAEAALVPLVALFLDAPLFRHPGLLALVCLLGTIGFAAVGSLFAAALVRHRGRDLLLGILLYPIALPVLIAGVRASEALMAVPLDGDTLWLWLRLLIAFDATFVTLALWVFEPIVAPGGEG